MAAASKVYELNTIVSFPHQRFPVRVQLIDLGRMGQLHLKCPSRLTSLEAAGVQTAVHYPQALHRQPVLRDCRCSGSLDNAREMADKVLCLPIHPTLSDRQVDFVAETLRSALTK